MARLPPLWQQNNAYRAQEDRRLIGELWPAVAVRGMTATVVTGTMEIQVAQGAAIALDARVVGASYLCVSDAPENVPITTAPPAGQDRIDVVVVTPRDSQFGGASNDWVFASVVGVPAPNPVVPAVPAGSTAIAQIRVVGGSAFIAAANLLDRRPARVLAAGMPDSAPRGAVAYATGPASAIVIGGAVTLVFQTTFPSVVGRRYKLSFLASWFGSGTGTGTNTQVRSRIDGADTQIQPTWTSGVNLWQGTTAFQAIDGNGAVRSFGIAAVAGAPAGHTITFNPNTCRLLAEDIGPTP
jgi:hypothetical protein